MVSELSFKAAKMMLLVYQWTETVLQLELTRDQSELSYHMNMLAEQFTDADLQEGICLNQHNSRHTNGKPYGASPKW